MAKNTKLDLKPEREPDPRHTEQHDHPQGRQNVSRKQTEHTVAEANPDDQERQPLHCGCP